MVNFGLSLRTEFKKVRVLCCDYVYIDLVMRTQQKIQFSGNILSYCWTTDSLWWVLEILNIFLTFARCNFLGGFVSIGFAYGCVFFQPLSCYESWPLTFAKTSKVCVTLDVILGSFVLTRVILVGRWKVHQWFIVPFLGYSYNLESHSLRNDYFSSVLKCKFHS